jgi:hypothetical protein
MGIEANDALWFAAQDTAAECQAISDAFGIAAAVDIDAYLYACMEDEWGDHTATDLIGPLICSNYFGCPAEHRLGMDGLGFACAAGSRRSICPCR